jgi:hypothetical protein
MDADLWSKLDKNDFEGAYPVYVEAKERVDELKKDKNIAKYDTTTKLIFK